MTYSEHLVLSLLLVLFQSGVYGNAIVKRDNKESVKNGRDFDKSLLDGIKERHLEQEILQELHHLSSRKQREIFHDLEKQREKFNISNKSLVFSETENLSPLNLEELNNVRKTIKATNTTLTLPPIRNKRTLNFLLFAVARAMGYTLTPTNPDAEWIPRQQPPSPQPCSTPPPPCRPNPPSTPPPCAAPPPASPNPCSNSLIQPATIPPNQIDANTISYPYRPARTIPLFNFAPLPVGVRVPYPPLLQPPAQQRSPCTQQPSTPPPCGATPAPSPPPCSTTPAPKSPPPCGPTSAPSPPPCGTTQAPSPPPCAMTTAPPPQPCKPTPTPPCGTTPAPAPCMTTPAPAPCMTTPAPSPCMSTSAPPPCATTPAPSQPCSTPQTTRPPPCSTPAPSPCGSPPPTPPPPPPPSSEPPKKGSILLEYDDPVRIQIFSNDKKFLPASGTVYGGHKDDWYSQFSPGNEKNRKKDEDFEEMEEEHIEEEEEDEAAGHLKHYEEEDERTLADNEEEEEDESETSLSIVKKPVDRDIQKKHRRRLVTSKTKSVSNNNDNKNEKEDINLRKDEKTQTQKKPKRKKWIRIIKKQRRKTKTDSNPSNIFQMSTSDTFPEESHVAPKYYTKRKTQSTFDSYETDISDFSGDPTSHSSEDRAHVDVKKVILNNEEINSPKLLTEAKSYEFNFNPFALEPEEQRRKKLEKAVERYVEDYVEKQLADELIKNTGLPKTTVFEFTPKNGPKIQTITTTVAKTSHNGNASNLKPETKPETPAPYKTVIGNAPNLRKNGYEENFKKRGRVGFDTFSIRA